MEFFRLSATTRLGIGSSIPRCSIIAFDGELVLRNDGSVIEIATGKNVGTGLNVEHAPHVAMIHDRVGYLIRGGNLFAIDLQNPEIPPVLMETEATLPVARAESGIQLWTGKRWKTIPWYVPSDRMMSGRPGR